MRRSALIITNSLIMLEHGVIMLLIGPVIPELMETLGIGEAQMGLILGIGTLGFTLAPFTGGLLIDKKGLRPTLLMALAAEVVFLVLFGFSAILVTTIIINFFLLFAAGNLEPTANYIPTLLGKARAGSIMNLVHFFFSVGAFITPFVIGVFLEGGGRWQSVYWAAAVFPLTLTIVFLFVRFPKPDHSTPAKELHGSIWKAVGHPAVIFGALTLFLYVGAELGFSNWLVNYGETRLGFTKVRAAMGTSLLWIGIMVGRVINIFLARKLTSRILNSVSSVLGALAGIFFIFAFSLAAFYGSVFVIGLAMGGVFPNTMAEINRRFPGRAGAVTGIMTFGAGLGAMVIQWFMGFLAENAGLDISMLVPPILMALAGVSYFVSFTLIQREIQSGSSNDEKHSSSGYRAK